MNSLDKTQLSNGLSIHLRPAPVHKRIMAFLIDAACLSGVFYLVMMVLIGVLVVAGTLVKYLAPDSILPGIVAAGGFIVFTLGILGTIHGYFWYFEKRHGSTPGKRIFGLKVVSQNGSVLSLQQVIIRDLARYVDCLLVLPGLLCILANKRGLRIGDMMAGTIVTYSKTAESDAQYVYLSRQHYQSLSRTVPLTPVPTEVARSYLSFAFPRYVMGKRIADDSQLKWEDYVRSTQSQLGDVFQPDNSDTMLRFYAEHCNQALKDAA